MCTSGGYIKIYRSIRDNWVWSDPEYLHHWIELLFNANWKDNKVVFKHRLIDIRRGEQIISERHLAREWKRSRNYVRRFLQMLTDDEMVSIRKLDHHLSILTICNYATYQDVQIEEGPLKDHSGTIKGPLKDHYKESKEDKEYNKKGISEDIPKESPTPKIDFQEFISEYHNECQKMPKVLKLSEKRKTKIKCRLSEFSKEQIFEAFKKAGQSNFMNGENNKNWKANFDWIMESENNILKILEGVYDNKGQKNKLEAQSTTISTTYYDQF